MSKYILIQTWNGEGYSDSKAEIIDAENFNEAVEVATEKAIEIVSEASDDANPNSVRIINKDKVIYSIGNDSGALKIIPFDNQFGVVLFPDTNSSQVFGTRKSYKDALTISCGEAHDIKDEIKSTIAAEEGCLHTGVGCEIFQLLKEDSGSNDLEFYESGDGVSYEVWRNTKTYELYKVHIDIVRNFSSKEIIEMKK